MWHLNSTTEVYRGHYNDVRPVRLYAVVFCWEHDWEAEMGLDQVAYMVDLSFHTTMPRSTTSAAHTHTHSRPHQPSGKSVIGQETTLHVENDSLDSPWSQWTMSSPIRHHMGLIYSQLNHSLIPKCCFLWDATCRYNRVFCPFILYLTTQVYCHHIKRKISSYWIHMHNSTPSSYCTFNHRIADCHTKNYSLLMSSMKEISSFNDACCCFKMYLPLHLWKFRTI